MHSIFHLSDIHIRVGDSQKSRFHEYATTFQHVVASLAAQPTIKEAIIVITGDLFHHKNKLEPCGLELALQLLRELAALAPVVLIRGNHDYRQDIPLERDMISALMGYRLPNVTYLDTTGVHTIGNIHFGVVAIQDTLLYGSASGIAKELPAFPKAPTGATVPTGAKAPEVPTEEYTIALFHGTIASCIGTHGYPIHWFGAYDAILLGDIHLQQIHRATAIPLEECDLPFTTLRGSYDFEQSPWGYPGSLLQQDFGESLFGHGYLHWDLRARQVHAYHITNPRGFIHVRTDDGMMILHDGHYVPAHQVLYEPWFPSQLMVHCHGSNERVSAYFAEHGKEVVYLRSSPSDAVADVADASDTDVHRLLRNINSLEVMMEYIRAMLQQKQLHLSDVWEQWLAHPEQLLISHDQLEPKMAKKIAERSDKLLACATRYKADMERAATHATGSGETLHLVRLEWDWILNFREGNLFDFERHHQHVALLNAKNGCGKSNFLEVICIALFGEGFPSRFNKNYTSTILCDKKPAGVMASTVLSFQRGGHNYTVKRVLKNNSDKRSIAFHEVVLTQDGAILHQGQTAVSHWIEANVGTLQGYLMTAMLSQNADCDFFSLDRAKQRGLLDQVLSLEHIPSLQALLKEAVLYFHYIRDLIETYRSGSAISHGPAAADLMAQLAPLRAAHSAAAARTHELYLQWNHLPERRLLAAEGLDGRRGEIQGALLGLTDQAQAPLLVRKGALDVELRTLRGELQRLPAVADAADAVADADADTDLGKLAETMQQRFKEMDQYPYEGDMIGETGKIVDSLERITAFKEWDTPMTSPLPRLKEIEQAIKSVTPSPVTAKAITALNKKIIKHVVRLEELQEERPNRPSLSLDEFQALRLKVGSLNVERIKEVPSLCQEINRLRGHLAEIATYREQCAVHPFNPRCKACKQQPWREQYEALLLQEPAWTSSLAQHTQQLADIGVGTVDHRLVQDCEAYHREDLLRRAYEPWTIAYEKAKQEHTVLLQEMKRLEQKKKEEDAALQEAAAEQQRLLAEQKQLLADLEVYQAHQAERAVRYPLYEKDTQQLECLWDQTVMRYRTAVATYRHALQTHIVQLETEQRENMRLIGEIQRRDQLRDEMASIVELEQALPLWKEWKEVRAKEEQLSAACKDCEAALRMSMAMAEAATEAERIKGILNTCETRAAILSSLSGIFDGYRSWLYTTQIAPLLHEHVNRVLRLICVDRVLLLDSEWLSATDTLSWFIKDGGSRIIVEKASGFQRFIVGIAIRVAFYQIGLCTVRFDQHFIDEGFTACDAENLELVPAFLKGLLVFYHSIYLVTHLDSLKAFSPYHVTIVREGGLSQIQHGERADVVAPLKKGRPPKTKATINRME